MQWYLSSRTVTCSREKGPVGTDQPTCLLVWLSNFFASGNDEEQVVFQEQEMSFPNVIK